MAIEVSRLFAGERNVVRGGSIVCAKQINCQPATALCPNQSNQQHLQLLYNNCLSVASHPPMTGVEEEK